MPAKTLLVRGVAEIGSVNIVLDKVTFVAPLNTGGCEIGLVDGTVIVATQTGATEVLMALTS